MWGDVVMGALFGEHIGSGGTAGALYLQLGSARGGYRLVALGREDRPAHRDGDGAGIYRRDANLKEVG